MRMPISRCLLRDRIGQQSIESDGREQGREESEYRGEDSGQSFRCGAVVHFLGKCVDFGKRRLGASAANARRTG